MEPTKVSTDKVEHCHSLGEGIVIVTSEVSPRSLGMCWKRVGEEINIQNFHGTQKKKKHGKNK
jgi:hypothetical protein